MSEIHLLLIAISAVLFYFEQRIRDKSGTPRAPNGPAALLGCAAFLVGSFGLVLAGRNDTSSVLVAWAYCALIFALMMGLCVTVGGMKKEPQP